MKKKLLFVCGLMLFASIVFIALADWDPEDDYKMHYPQLPDPFGWDVAFYGYFGGVPLELADDWMCTETGPVSDVHFWISWYADDVSPIQSVRVKIYSNNPMGPNGWSEPDVLLWDREFLQGQFTERPYGTGDQGWYDPLDGYYESSNHMMYYQVNITDIDDPYIQQEGDIYWLSLEITGMTSNMMGWKTSLDHWNDDAVWRDAGGPWEELRDPLTQESIDFSFVITTEEEPKPLMPHTKWSQPAIEIDPTSAVPTYCGWDEESHNKVDVGTPLMKIVADDFRCLGTMPVKSIHWWGSFYDFEWWWAHGQLPAILPARWWIGFWSNVPANSDPYYLPYSYPDILLHSVTIPANRVTFEEVGYDEYYHQHPNDICYQYNVDLQPDEVFWQNDFNDMTQDRIYWISIVAEYNDVDPDYKWGWKTRPWHWMDDAVTFMLYYEPAVGEALDPFSVGPIEDPVWGESMDVSFELDTSPNYIKWEQLYTGIRDWPHYEDEVSMNTVETTTVEESKWLQDPDLSPSGIDVDATMELTGNPLFPPQILADDFNCVLTGPITHINIWGSWLYDDIPLMDPHLVEFTLSIYSDNPSGVDGWSEPNQLLWRKDFLSGSFTADLVYDGSEGYYSPCVSWYEQQNHFLAWMYGFDIDPSEAFVQQGDPCAPEIYWLAVQARPLGDGTFRFGWKTSIMHWNDDAVWTTGEWGDPRDPWVELRHPETSESLDLAFEIITSREEQLITDVLAADDWQCLSRTPVTAIVWWGSYIGYQYEACSYGPFMPLPVSPDRFRLNVWTDVPADPNVAGSYSHPGDIIWSYETKNYDEVLVGYDKYPHPPGQPSIDPNEPVFRYSVRLPKDAWFHQPDYNGIFWLSVQAVYDINMPNYDWGWTNHQHVFNDDAVQGTLAASGDEWNWTELHDQTGASEDLSFILFTDPNAHWRCYAGQPDEAEWVSVGEPNCWCWPRQCLGDADGLPYGKSNFWVSAPDLTILKAAWNINNGPTTIPGICADYDHLPYGKSNFRVSSPDLTILKFNWNITNGPAGTCSPGNCDPSTCP